MVTEAIPAKRRDGDHIDNEATEEMKKYKPSPLRLAGDCQPVMAQTVEFLTDGV